MSSRRYTRPEMPMAQPSSPYMQTNATVAPPTQPNVQIFPWGNEKILNPSPVPSTNTTLPPYFRPTIKIIPETKEALEGAGIPFGVIINPDQVTNVPVLDYSNATVIRCSSCNAYLSPYTEIDPDQKFYKCPMCHKKSQVPTPKCQSEMELRPIGMREELKNPVYDIITPKAYISMPYACPAFCFVIDMSIPAVTSGFTQQFLYSSKAAVEIMPEYYRVQIVTISDILTVFDIRAGTEVVVADLEDTNIQFPYCPTISEAKDNIFKAFDSLLKREPRPKATGVCYGSFLESVDRILGMIGGIVLVGIASPPIFGPHPIIRKETTQTTEFDLIRPPKDGSCTFFREVSFRINKAAISINVFSMGLKDGENSVAVIPCGLTGGKARYYPSFDLETAMQMHTDIFSVCSTEYCLNATIRLRASDGIKLVRPQGSFAILHGNLLQFPVLNPQNSVCFELAVESPLNVSNALFQIALLWTTMRSVRMIRIFTFSLPTSRDINLIRSSVDEAALASLYIKRTVMNCLTQGPPAAVERLKKEFSVFSSRNVHFESLHYLMHALAFSALCKRVHPMGPNGRMREVVDFRSFSIVDGILEIYPRMFALDTNTGPLPLDGSSFSYGTVFLIHKSQKIYIWVSPNVSPEYLQAVFGVSSIDQLPSEVPVLGTDENRAVTARISECMKLSFHYIPVYVFTQGSEKEAEFQDILIDQETQSHPPLHAWLREIGVQLA